ELARIDHLGLGQDRLDLARASLDEGLLLLGRVKLGVLPQIAVGPGLLDVLHVLGALHLAQLLELFLEAPLAPRGHRVSIGHFSGTPAASRPSCHRRAAWQWLPPRR